MKALSNIFKLFGEYTRILYLHKLVQSMLECSKEQKKLKDSKLK